MWSCVVGGSGRGTMRVAGQIHQGVAMAFRQLGKIVRPRGVEAFKRRKRVVQKLDQLTRSIEFVISKPGPWLGAVQRGRLSASELFELKTEAIKIPREAVAS